MSASRSATNPVAFPPAAVDRGLSRSRPGRDVGEVQAVEAALGQRVASGLQDGGADSRRTSSGPERAWFPVIIHNGTPVPLDQTEVLVCTLMESESR